MFARGASDYAVHKLREPIEMDGFSTPELRQFRPAEEDGRYFFPCEAGSVARVSHVVAVSGSKHTHLGPTVMFAAASGRPIAF